MCILQINLSVFTDKNSHLFSSKFLFIFLLSRFFFLPRSVVLIYSRSINSQRLNLSLNLRANLSLNLRLHGVSKKKNRIISTDHFQFSIVGDRRKEKQGLKQSAIGEQQRITNLCYLLSLSVQQKLRGKHVHCCYFIFFERSPDDIEGFVVLKT